MPTGESSMTGRAMQECGHWTALLAHSWSFLSTRWAKKDAREHWSVWPLEGNFRMPPTRWCYIYGTYIVDKRAFFFWWEHPNDDQKKDPNCDDPVGSDATQFVDGVRRNFTSETAQKLEGHFLNQRQSWTTLNWFTMNLIAAATIIPYYRVTSISATRQVRHENKRFKAPSSLIVRKRCHAGAAERNDRCPWVQVLLLPHTSPYIREESRTPSSLVARTSPFPWKLWPLLQNTSYSGREEARVHCATRTILNMSTVAIIRQTKKATKATTGALVCYSTFISSTLAESDSHLFPRKWWLIVKKTHSWCRHNKVVAVDERDTSEQEACRSFQMIMLQARTDAQDLGKALIYRI